MVLKQEARSRNTERALVPYANGGKKRTAEGYGRIRGHYDIAIIIQGTILNAQDYEESVNPSRNAAAGATESTRVRHGVWIPGNIRIERALWVLESEEARRSAVATDGGSN